MFELLYNSPELFLDTRVSTDHFFLHIFFCHWDNSYTLLIWDYLEPADHQAVAWTFLHAYVHIYDTIQDLVHPAVCDGEPVPMIRSQSLGILHT